MQSHRTLLFFLLLTTCLVASEVRAQDPKGSELRINPRIAGMQWVPGVATAADGSFVVVWQVGGDRLPLTGPVLVMARLFDAAGRPRGGEIRIAQHERTSFGLARVAMAADGHFVVVWGSGTERAPLALGRLFSAQGLPLGPAFRLAKGTARVQEEPNVAMAPDGSFVTAWTQRVTGDAEVNTDVFLRRFSATGRPLGPEVLAIGGYEEQSGPELALRPDGSIVIACVSWGGESSFYDVEARLLDRSGAPLGDDFLVNDGPHPEVSQLEPRLAVAADGRFAIAWTDQGADFDRIPDHTTSGDRYTGAAVRFFAADGTPQGPGLFANAFLEGAQSPGGISALQAGGFLVVWTSGGGQDGDGAGIFARVYGADGQPRGREYRINLNRAGSQTGGNLSIAPNGKGVVVWSGPDGDANGIFARLLGRPGA
jgi:hypothetical protein